VAKEIPVKMPDGGTVCAIVVRPRVKGKLPALFNFTIYADPENTFGEALRAASNGYAGVVGLTRGKGCSPDKPMPYEHDSAVSDETIQDAGEPLRIQWFADSYVDVPINR
jgi:cephalosporin-C deacetylase-like acetyl esterase